MDTLTINEAALAHVLEEIFGQRRKNFAKSYSQRLAKQIFQKAYLASSQIQAHVKVTEGPRRATDAEVKELLGIYPLESYPCDEGLIGNAP
jgi:hypothetical protein